MPLSFSLAQKLAIRLTEVRKNNIVSYFRPDGKTQVSVEYVDDVPIRVDTILISQQHDPDVSIEQIKEDIKREVIDKVIPRELMDDKTKIYINPTGRFVIGGPLGDTGLTGRKLVVDTYGGAAHHGGGAFSGKDPTKVDRSASYMLRYIAKNIVAAKLARKIEIQVSYGIGLSKPLSLYVNTFNTSKLTNEELVNIIYKEFDLSPKAIIDTLDLRRPIYFKTSSYGCFGRLEKDFPWERLDRVKDLEKYL